jgi:hypothetical protein
MSDDWRLRIDLHDAAAATELAELLERSEHELEGTFHDQVALSRDGAEVFAYTGTRELSDRLEELVRSQASSHGWTVRTELKHWHPTAEQWEDPDVPLPADDAALAAEHAERIERERERLAERGYPEFEVRIEFAQHRDAKRFVERLREEGVPNVHRWKYVVVGAADEDAAAELAERLRAEAPSGCTVRVEGTWEAMRADTPTSLRSTIFGATSG